MTVLSDRLKEAREMKSKEDGRRITQVMVYHATGVHDKTLGGYENAVSEPDAETLRILATYYGVTVDWLTGNSDNPYKTEGQEFSAAIKELSVDELVKNHGFILDGRKLTEEEARGAIAWILAQRHLEK